MNADPSTVPFTPAPFVIYPTWPALPYVKAFMTTRQGGESIHEYESWNLADRVEDDLETVKRNRQRLIQNYHLPSMPLWLKQVHGNQVVCADQLLNHTQPDSQAVAPIEADASFSLEPHRVCVVMTADCLPILLTDEAGTWVAAVHGGWRGLHAGIIKNTVVTAEKKGIPSTTLQAWLGAAISADVYEIGEEVYEAFVSEDQAYQTAFKPHLLSPQKWYLSLYDIARYQLQQLGITRIYGGTYCTYQQKDLFFSYRRQQARTGRMATLIWMDNRGG